MAASCTFGISFSIGGACYDDFIHDPSPVTSPSHTQAHDPIQYEDGLCPYSDEKEVVVDEENYVDRSVWRTTTTTEDLMAGEDAGSSTSTTTDHIGFSSQNTSGEPQHRSGKLAYTRAWHLTKSAVKNASSSTTKYLAPSAPHQFNTGASGYGISVISRAEFEKLPLTIQRKHFSTIERLRLAKDLGDPGPQDPDLASGAYTTTAPHQGRAATSPLSLDKDYRPHSGATHRSRTGSKSFDVESRNYPRLSSLDQELLTRLPDKVKRRHLTREEQLLAQHQQFIAQHRNPSGLLEDLENEKVKRQKRLNHLDLAEILESNSTASIVFGTDMSSGSLSSIQDRANLDRPEKSDFYDTLRWLEQDEGLDLRLCIDEPDQRVPAAPEPQYDVRPSIRRHLSLSSRLSFGRPSLTLQSRPSTNDDATVLPRQATATSHARSRSRAMSLMSPSHHFRPDSSPAPDAGAAYYQDPEARLILRSHLASTQKFDEAVEFGFPSVDEDRRDGAEPNARRVPDPLDEFRTWLNDDKSSINSDRSSVPESESPKTPPILERPAPSQPYRVLNDHPATSFSDYPMPMPMREMTLRMTLTRPDLRAGESDIYGWQQSVHSGRAHHMRGESFAPGTGFRQMSPKTSIERQFSAIDQGVPGSLENGSLKRLWKRVRRA